jgi:hypothetical protein
MMYAEPGKNRLFSFAAMELQKAFYAPGNPIG